MRLLEGIATGAHTERAVPAGRSCAPRPVQGESAIVKEGLAKHPRRSVNLAQGAAATAVRLTAALPSPPRACLKHAAAGAEIVWFLPPGLPVGAELELEMAPGQRQHPSPLGLGALAVFLVCLAVCW